MLIAGCILAALVMGALVFLTVSLTMGFLKKYRKRKNTKIFVGIVKDICKNAPTMSLDDLPDEEDVIIAEYDEEDDELVQDMSVSRDRDVDGKFRNMLKNNGGIVIFE